MKDSCFMIQRPIGGGGNAASAMFNGAASPLIVRRTAAIGDALCATVIADKLISMGYEVAFQSHINIHCVLRRHPKLFALSTPGGFCHVDLDGTYEGDPDRRLKSFHQMFYEAANSQLMARGLQVGQPRNCRPRIVVRRNEREAVQTAFAQYPKPWIFICPRSDAYACRQVPDGIWSVAAGKMHGTKFWIGRHPAPAGIVDMRAQHLDNVIVWLSAADILVTVDTGPMHIAAALGVPIVAISQSSSPDQHLNDQNDFISVAPPLDCLNCQKNICPINQFLPPCQNISPDLVADWTNARCRSISGNDVSAIIPIYQPEAKTLNQCLECVLPQVQEVIVTAEANSRIPDGAMKHDRIRYVRKPEPKIGYGRNVNFGARHSNGRYLLLLNDDIFLDPGAVDAMKSEMVPQVGLVAHLLRYPDGTIYHAGKRRAPGQRGWGHIDYRKHLPTITEPTEMENVCGASVLVDRRAFYDIGGFDEDFFIYAEDDDFCLRMRRAGYRIVYTPRASGVHLEHQSTQKLGSIQDIVNSANRLFTEKWAAYLDWNAQRVPGNFDYLKA